MCANIAHGCIDLQLKAIVLRYMNLFRTARGDQDCFTREEIAETVNTHIELIMGQTSLTVIYI